MNAPDNGGIKRAPSAGSGDLQQRTRPLPAGAQEDFSGAGDSAPVIRIDDVLAARYRILRRLGKGGMGEVFEAEDLELHTRIALKTIRPEIALQPDALERFKREVHLARKVTHPNVCRIFDLGYHAASSGVKTWFLTMELLAGPTLAQTIVQSGRMSVAEALPIVKQLAAGLDAAHQAGIVHRDFKSANVILLTVPTGSESVPLAKITDFGLARASSGDETTMASLPGQGSVAGTPAYMAPEQIEGAQVSPRTDIYAFGVVIYEMLTGVLPFSGSSPWAVAIKHVKDAPVSPRVHSPGIDQNWETAVLRCLEKSPADRFASASEVVAAVEGGRVPAVRKSRRVPWPALAALMAIALMLVGAYYATRIFSARRHGPAPAESTAARYGWHQKLFPADVLPSDITVIAAAAVGARQLTLFGKSLVQTWRPEQHPQPPVQIGFTIAGRADCSPGVWLVHDDHQHITNWDTEKQRALKEISLPQPFESATCLDRDGTAWAILTRNGRTSRLFRFDARTNRSTDNATLPVPYLKVTIDPAKRYLVLIGNDSISIRTPGQFAELVQASLSETLLRDVSYGWSPSGRYLGLGVKQFAIYDLVQKKWVNTLTLRGWASDVGWISDDNLSVMDDRGHLYWTSHPLKGWELDQAAPWDSVYHSFWIPTELRWLAIDEAGKSVVWDYATPSQLFDLAISPLELWSIAANSEGPTVAVSGKDPRIFIIDLQQRKVIRTLEGHTDGVPLVRYDPYHRLISAGDDGTIRTWDPNSGKLLQTVQAHRSLVNAFAISPDGHWLVSVSSDARVKVWSLPDLRLVRELGQTNDSGAAVSFLDGRDQSLLVSDWGGGLYLYSGVAPNWTLQQQFRIGEEEIYMVCPAQDGWWATVPGSSKAGLWFVPANDIRQARQITEAAAYYCWTSPDRRRTAIVFPTGIQLRSNFTGMIEGAYYSANPASSVAIQPHPPMVLTGLDNGHVLAWPSTGQ